MATKLFLAAYVSLLLAACGTYVNPSNSQANYAQDKYACEQEAARLMPTLIAYTFESTQAECRAKDREGRCIDFIPPTRRAVPYDTNEAARSNLTYSCIKAKGWIYQSK